MNKIEKAKESALRIGKNFAPALAEGIKTLGLINPAFLLLIPPLQAVLGYWGDYATDKTLDLFKEFEEHKEEIVEEIVRSDKFKAIFLKIVGDNITESNEKKRQYLKNYIVNMARGMNPGFNEHTKLITTLNNITLEEIDMLNLWDGSGVIERWYREKNSVRFASLTVHEIETIVRGREECLGSLAFGKHYADKNNQILLSLGYKGLLYVLGKESFGSGVEARVRYITDFGKDFLSFIKR